MGRRGRRWSAGIVAVAALVVAACAPTTPSGDPAWYGYHLHGWTPVGSTVANDLTQNQGLATVQRPPAPDFRFFAGSYAIPQDQLDAGWNHVGDPGSRDGYLVLPYQAADGSAGKRFAVSPPTGPDVAFHHALAPGELYNNSFAAVSPDGQWLVSGEWGTMTRLLVMPMPILNPAAVDPAQDLPLAGTIELEHPVDDVQGCDFTSHTRLVCASDADAAGNQPTPKPLLQIDLAAPLAGTTVTGRVTDLGELPRVSTCTGSFEVEGVDVDPTDGHLRVEVVPPFPCAIDVAVYEYAPT